MPASVTLYGPRPDPVPLDMLRQLAADAQVSEMKDDGDLPTGYCVAWNDVRVTLTVMPQDQLAEHLQGFQDHVMQLAGEDMEDDDMDELLDRIEGVRLVQGVIVDPDFDDEGKANRLVLDLLKCYQALLFTGGALYDEHAQLLLGAEEQEEVGEENEEEGWQPTPNQLERAERSRALLRRRRMPLYLGPLFVDDDQEAILRAPAEVARRALVLWAVAQRGEGMPQERALALLDRMGMRDAVSPKEKEFLDDPNPAAEVAGRFVWRLEALWVLLWALGHLDDLGWPEGFCDVSRLVNVLRPREGDPTFVSKARLRPVGEILDAQDLTMRMHWAIRDSWLKKQPLPADLNWTGRAERLPAEQCAAVGVVEQRHHTLNWLVRFGDADWDDVDTPT